jgi:predicted Co/Zn/Cd cation transporter (cation efflux family)
MRRALIAASAYFVALFCLGFVLGTIRVLFVAPRIGVLGATLAEVPLMLAAAFFMCRWAIGRWQVPPAVLARGAMALWFLVLLALFETLVGVALFGRTLAGTWAELATPAGLIGLAAQAICALLPLVLGRTGRR